MSDDFKKDLQIDFSSLDTDWRDHSILYMEWSEKWVNAVATKDRAKEFLDVTKAEVDKEIRMSFSGKSKLTETAIASLVITDERYRKAYEQVVKDTENVNLMQVAKSAFEARKKALEGLTQLWVAGYYSTPNMPKEFRKEAKKRVEESAITAQHTIAKGGGRRLLEKRTGEVK